MKWEVFSSAGRTTQVEGVLSSCVHLTNSGRINSVLQQRNERRVFLSSDELSCGEWTLVVFTWTVCGGREIREMFFFFSESTRKVPLIVSSCLSFDMKRKGIYATAARKRECVISCFNAIPACFSTESLVWNQILWRFHGKSLGITEPRQLLPKSCSLSEIETKKALLCHNPELWLP